jgi:hypothetical protein
LCTHIKTFEANIIKNGETTKDFLMWKAWAEQKISWYDPLIDGQDPLLTDYHKTNLFKDFLKE